MAIDKTFGVMPPTVPGIDNPDGVVEYEVGADGPVMDEGYEIIELEDGGVEVVLPDAVGAVPDLPFNANLAEWMSDQELHAVANELKGLYEGDELARKDWKDTFDDGLDYLGLKIETRDKPWTGACGITHPLMSEAIVRFQSQQIGELFPAAGPTRTKIVGRETPERVNQATRIQGYMNYMLTEKMEEYRSETDEMLFNLAGSGSSFKKTYWSDVLKRPVSEYVGSEDFVVGAGTKSLVNCTRMTHINRTDLNEIRKLQVSGFYRDVQLSPQTPQQGEIEEKKAQISGQDGHMDGSSLATLLEIHTDLDLPGFEDYSEGNGALPEGTLTGIALPYVVTLDKDSLQVLSIRRNWLEGDAEKKRRQHFTHYQYIPGLGFYGLGLIHLIGGIAKGSTSILRQLVDSGTLATLPGGFKSRGMRIKGDQTPIAPGEWRDVDVSSGAIRDHLFPAPYGEPSQVLAALLGSIVEEGRRFASLTDVNISSMNNEAPVGTTLALLERNLKVMTAISARIHASQRRELKILSSIIADHYTEYPYDVGDPSISLAKDFDGAVDILPVSDPNSSTMSQRIMTAQTAIQMMERAPQYYKGGAILHQRMLRSLEIQDVEEIIPTEDDIRLLDPVTENQNILNGIPVKAFAGQDQLAHIQTHMAAAQDPKMLQLIQNAPNAASIQGAGMAHVVEHLALKYREDIERNLGIQLPPQDQPLPPEIERDLSRMIAEGAQQLFSRNVAEQRSIDIQEKLQDPVIQDQLENTAIKRLEAETRAKAANDSTELKIADLLQKYELKDRELGDERDLGVERIRAQLLGEIIEAASRTEALEHDASMQVANFIMDQAAKESDGVRKALEEKVTKDGKSIKLLVDLMNKAADKNVADKEE